MNDMTKRDLILGISLLAAFAAWTAAVQVVDVQPVGQCGTDIGIAAPFSSPPASRTQKLSSSRFC